MKQPKTWIVALGVFLITGLLGAGGVAAYRKAQAEHRKQLTDLPEQIATPVRVARVERRPAGFEVRTHGFLTPYETLGIAAEVTGRVEQQHVEVSDPVLEGSVLFELDHALLDAAQEKALAEKQKADSTVNQARFNAQRVEKLKRQDSANPIEIQDVETALERALAIQKEAQAALDEVTIRIRKSIVRAPSRGVVARIYARQGEFARAGQLMADIIIVDRLKLNVQLNDREVVGFEPGDDVSIEAVAIPSRRFAGRILRIYPQASAQSRKFEVEIEVPNDQGLLRPGFFVNARLIPSGRSGSSGEVPSIVVIPRLATMVRHQQPYCFTVAGDGPDGGLRAHWTPLETRPLSADPQYVQVLSGVAPGQTVVMSGLQDLADGALVSLQE